MHKNVQKLNKKASENSVTTKNMMLKFKRLISISKLGILLKL